MKLLNSKNSFFQLSPYKQILKNAVTITNNIEQSVNSLSRIVQRSFEFTKERLYTTFILYLQPYQNK